MRFFILVTLFCLFSGPTKAADPVVPDSPSPSGDVPASAPVVEPPPQAVVVPSEPNESQVVIVAPSSFRWGVEVSGLGALSSVDYDSGFSGGAGWAAGLRLKKELSPALYGIATVGYQSLTMGRYIASSGVVVDESSQFNQTQEGIFVQGLLGIPIWETQPGAREQLRIDWELGGEYFHGLKARQNSSFNVAHEFTPGRFVFAVSGPSLTWLIRGGWQLSCSSRFFVNTVGESRFKLMGARLGLALRTPL